MNQALERKLAAIMFTDIAGYTALSAKDSAKSSELLKTQRKVLKPIVEKHGGSWMKEIGLETTTYLYLTYQLLEDKSYLETAYNQVQEKASAMDIELSKKFLSYLIPKAIGEEWRKVK